MTQPDRAAAPIAFQINIFNAAVSKLPNMIPLLWKSGAAMIPHNPKK